MQIVSYGHTLYEVQDPIFWENMKKNMKKVFQNNQLKGFTVENISWSISTKECCRPGMGRTRNLLITKQTHIQLSTEAGLNIYS